MMDGPVTIRRLIQHYDRIADAPDTVPRLRRFILDLAVRGKLVPQDPGDEPAAKLLMHIARAKERLSITHEVVPVQAGGVPFDLPAGWVWTRIGEICSKTGSGSTPRGGRTAYKASGIPFLRSQNVYDDGLRLDDVAFIDAETHAKMGGTAVRPKDLLLNITGGSMGRCCRVPDHFGDANVSQHVAIIRTALPSLEYFLHCVILSPYFQSFIFDQQTGAGRGGLPKKNMDRIIVALPPLPEQRRIVAKVDELMAVRDRLQAARAKREATRDLFTGMTLARLSAPDPAVVRDDARLALDALPALTARADQIKQLRQTILNLAVRGKLVARDPNDISPLGESSQSAQPWANELPQTWSVVPLSDLLAEDTRNGYSRRPDDAPSGTPILRISAATVRQDGIVAEEEHKLISGIKPDVRLQYGLRPGDLLACRFNGNKAFVGRLSLFTNYLGSDPIYPDKLIRVRVLPKVALPPYLQLAANSDLVRAEIEAVCATTVGNWGISASKLKTVRFPLPPMSEQDRIVTKVRELMALCDSLEASLAAGETARLRLLDALFAETLEPRAGAVLGAVA